MTIALVEIGLTPDMFQTLQDYTRVNRIESPSASRYAELSLGRGSACGDEFNVEEQLDVESSYDMAPLANQLVIGGDSCNDGFYGLQALFDADTAILNGVGGHPLAQIASNSWEGNDESQPLNLVNIEHAYLLRAAAEGVSMLFSAGDGSGVLTPSSDPYATAVGGTTLGIGRKDPRLFETGWSTGVSFDVNNRWIPQGEAYASGGGAEPALGAAGIPARRRAELAGQGAGQPGRAGPRAARHQRRRRPVDRHGRRAAELQQQGRRERVRRAVRRRHQPGRAAGRGPGGRRRAVPAAVRVPQLGPLPAGRNPRRHDALPITGNSPSRYRGVACDVADCGVLSYFPFDVQSWSMAGYTGQVTRKGYDTMTGIGTPNGQNFVYALRRIFG